MIFCDAMRGFNPILAALAALALVVAPAPAQHGAAAQTAKRHMVSAAHPLAARAGL